MPVSSVKLGSFCESHQFGGNRRFLQTQFSATQLKILLPEFEPGRRSVSSNGTDEQSRRVARSFGGEVPVGGRSKERFLTSGDNPIYCVADTREALRKILTAAQDPPPEELPKELSLAFMELQKTR